MQRRACVLGMLTALAACGGDAPASGPRALTRLTTDRTFLRDESGRYVTLHGVNLSGTAKVPAKVGDVTLFAKGRVDPRIREPLMQGTASYVGKPFPGYATTLAEIGPAADSEMKKLRDAGFNAVRLMINWEGAEPTAKGVYDLDYLKSLRLAVEAANKYGIYVLLDMHQDLFSRFLVSQYNEKPGATDDIGKFLGSLFPPYTDVVRGEGAPRWVVEACLQEKNLDSPNWAKPRLLANLDLGAVCDLLTVYTLVTGKQLVSGLAAALIETTCADPVGQKDGFCNTVAGYQQMPACTPGGPTPCNDLAPWISSLTGYVCNPDSKTYPMTESSGMLPFFPWGGALATSLEANRCYACLFAGDKVFPGLTVKECQDDPCLGATPPAQCADPCRVPRTPTPVASCSTDKVVDVDVKTYLQDAYAHTWQQVACQMKGLPNVVGYDLMNEPSNVFYYLTAAAVFASTGVTDEARTVLVSLLGKVEGEYLHKVLTGLRLFPPLPARIVEPTQPVAPTVPVDPGSGATEEQKDRYVAETVVYDQAKKDYDAAKAEYDAYPARKAKADADRAAILKEWGLDKVDLLGAIGLNNAFDWNYMRPFYDVTAKAVMAVDKTAVMYLEGAMGGPGLALSGTGSLTRPDSVPPGQVVQAPHFYPDIMPFLGFGFRPRCFAPEEIRWRDYSSNLVANMSTATWALGHVPAVFGEFGTWFNFCAYEDDPTSREMGEMFSEQILDSIYEGLEALGLSHMQWVYSPDADPTYGDWFDHEDFSIQGYDGQWRGQLAWSRPFARALAGKPISAHFWSDGHYFEPLEHAGEVTPRREFEVRYEGKETDAPTEIVIPDAQYPDGFYVWVSDGRCAYDPTTRVLNHYPDDDAPGAVHFVRVLPPLAGRVNTGWQYFFQGDQVVHGN